MSLKKENKRFYLYQLRVSGEALPFYVGKTFEGSLRLKRHLSESYTVNKNRIRSRIIRKALQEHREILEEKLVIGPEEYIFELESKLIFLYGRRDLRTGTLANETDGGDGVSGYINTEDVRRKKSLSAMGNQKGRLRKPRPYTPRPHTGKAVDVFDESGKLIDTLPSQINAAHKYHVNPKDLNAILKLQSRNATKGIGDIYFRFRNAGEYNELEPYTYKKWRRKFQEKY
jgi:hypothetical protein